MAFFAPDIGIDLGTSNTMVYVRGRGIVISEPTIVVTDANNRRNVRAAICWGAPRPLWQRYCPCARALLQIST